MRTCFSPWPGAWCPSLPTFTPTTWSPPSVAPSAPALQTPVAQVGWQILTGTVRIYHVSVDCQESCNFLKWLHFPEVWSAKGNIVTREIVTLLVPPKCDILSIPDNFCYTRWSKFDDALWLTPLLSRVSNCAGSNIVMPSYCHVTKHSTHNSSQSWARDMCTFRRAHGRMS